MAGKHGQQEWFIAERARALALVHLTRRDDLLIQAHPHERGLAFLVDVTQGGKPTSRRFGVAVRGVRPAVAVQHANKVLKPTLQSFLKTGPFAFAVCLFFFTMQDDAGYYTWIAEPALLDGTRPKLKAHGTANCATLNREALAGIVVQVNEWYDAFFAAVAV